MTSTDFSLYSLLCGVKDVVEIEKAFDEVEFLYIADGHHRTAAACR